MTEIFNHRLKHPNETYSKQISSIHLLDMTFHIIQTFPILECLNFQISISKQIQTCFEDLTLMSEIKLLPSSKMNLFWTLKETLVTCLWWNLLLLEKRTFILMKFQVRFKSREIIILKGLNKANKLWIKFSKNSFQDSNKSDKRI